MSEQDVTKRDLTPEEYLQIVNNFQFSSSRFSNGVLNDIDEKELQKYLSNPERYNKELQKYAFYQYITEGNIYQLFDLCRVLPNLNYTIKSLIPNKSNQNRILTCRRSLNELNHKELTRDIISQLISTGTLVGVWVGKEQQKSKENPYLVIFDDLEYFFPGRRKNGKWTVWCDLSYFTSGSDLDYKIDILNNLSPYITEEDVENFIKKGESYRYVEFPTERSVCLRTHTLRRNQRFGIPWNTPSIFDIKHKQKLRNLEKIASNKVMNAVAVLTLGLDNEKANFKALGKKLTTSTFNSVKKGLMNNKDGDVSVVGLPEWGKLEYPDTKVDEILNPNKIESISEDIAHDNGVSRGLTNGKDVTYAVAKLDIDIMFNRIGEILENIEYEVYGKFLKIILPNSVGNDYIFEYEKTYPLSNQEKATILQNLVASGYSSKYLIELLGINFDEFIQQSLYEIEEMDLRNKITPPMTSYTMNGDETKKESDDGNESTQNSKENNDSKTPRPSKK